MNHVLDAFLLLCPLLKLDAPTAPRASTRPPVARLLALLATPASTSRCPNRVLAWTAIRAPMLPRVGRPHVSIAPRGSTAEAGPRRVWRARRATSPFRRALPHVPPVVRVTIPAAGPLSARRVLRATIRVLRLPLLALPAQKVRDEAHTQNTPLMHFSSPRTPVSFT